MSQLPDCRDIAIGGRKELGLGGAKKPEKDASNASESSKRKVKGVCPR